MATIIDGKKVSSSVRSEIAEESRQFYSEYHRNPGLAVIIVGNDPASQVYVRNKKKACEEVGFLSEIIELPENTDETELLDVIEKLNENDSIDGILVQLPLPAHINEKKIIESIDPYKDVDAFHPYNTGKILSGSYSFLPCTPAGIMELLKRYNIEVDGKECVVIGRSNIVGKPMAILLLEANGTVTVCHSHTENIKEICKRADIIVVAVGKSGFLKADMVKPGAVIIDVGINRNAEGKLSGDVDFENVEPIASYITPVPGGVGPMTISMLLINTLKAAKLHYGKN